MSAPLLGVVGGIGPESTIDYYKRLVTGYRARTKASPPVVINSIDVDEVLRMVGSDDLPGLTWYLLSAIETLSRAGATVGIIAANTPHIVFDDVCQRTPIRLISIVEATCQHARNAGMQRLLLLGTRFVMSGSFFQRVATRHGLELVVPSDAEQVDVHSVYVNELLKGSFLEGSRNRVVSMIDRLTEARRIDGVILAGTELPLLLRTASTSVPCLDTTAIHVDAALTELAQVHEIGS